MTRQSGQDAPPPLPGSSRKSESSERIQVQSAPPRKVGRLQRWFWAPVRETENWAQTVFRVLGNLLRIVLTICLLCIAIILSIVVFFVAKEERPEWFGSAHLTEWCDDQYGNQYSKHERSGEVCSARWAEYEKFTAACDVAERTTRNLLQIDCKLPEQPHYSRLQSFMGTGSSSADNASIATAKTRRATLRRTLSLELGAAQARCMYVQSQLDRRRCNLSTETANETEAKLVQLEELIANAEAENAIFSEALSACFDARRARNQKVYNQVIATVEAADRLHNDLNTRTCAFRAKGWAPGIYSSD